MKSARILKLIAAASATVALALCANAAGFDRMLQYKDGMFKDVAANAWYASEVKSAYELGFMNGVGDGQFSPDGNVTVSAGITMAARVHAIYNGKTIAEKKGANWYDMYVDYAKANGIIADGQFDNFDRNITRIEMALLFTKAMPADYFTAKNDVKSIPDVTETEDYYAELIKLYKAGVVMGSDAYGTFYPNNSIKRSETAAIINRVALPENRLSKTLEDYGDRPMAAYLIDDHSMQANTRGKLNNMALRSGWLYENRNSGSVNKDDVTTNVLADKGKGYVAINKYLTVQDKGTVVLESVFTLTGDGARIFFTDSDGKNAIEVCTKGGTYHVIGNTDSDTGVKYTTKSTVIRLSMNLDTKKASLVIDAQDAGTFDMLSEAKNIARMWYATSEEGALTFTPNATHLYKDFTVNDVFRIDAAGNAPYGWTVTSKTTAEKTPSMNTNSNDTCSVKIDGTGTAKRSFDALDGMFTYETQLWMPEYAVASFALKNGDKTAVEVKTTKDGQFVSGSTSLRKFTANVWQTLRIEGNTATGKALVKINGKKCAEVDLAEKKIDNVVISFDEAGKVLWFDDVIVKKEYEYTDYCPTPVPVTDDEWYVGMSICSLWHEGTHFGWDCVSAYDEAKFALGYYDEGIPEVADWEIKFMVEHGVDFQHFCWYVSSSDKATPIKTPRLADALNNGYMNAKYSDMQKFSIMFENSASSAKSAEDFKETIWPYWVDWYFTDSRYMSIDNKAVLTIYTYSKFVEQMGGEEKAKDVINFMKTEIKKYGYDGMLVFFSDRGANSANNKKMKDIGADGLVSYTFGENSYSSQYQIDSMNSAYKAGNLDLVPSIGVGFNDVGWTGERTPNATTEEHTKVLEWARDTYLPMLAKRDSANAWKGKFVFMTTWNEYGEGHYIMPSGINGFGYLDDMRSVFSSAAGKTDNHYDVVPTKNQLSRLNFMYSGETTRIRRQMNIATKEDYGTDALRKWDFTDEKTAASWRSMMNTSKFAYDSAEKALAVNSSTTDAAIVPVDQNTATKFNASEVEYLHVCIKTDTVSAFTLYFKTGDKDWAAAKCYAKTMRAGGEYNDYYVKLSDNNNWIGEITGIRFDPNTIIGKVWIKTIEFLKPSAASAFTIHVDGTDFKPGSDLVAVRNGETYLAAEQYRGFYSLHNTYVEWHKNDGVLLLKTPNNTEFVFTVGSDKALVNGKETALKEKFSLFDGLPVIPLEFFYNNGGFDYKKTENGYELTIREGGYTEIIKNRVDYEWEFEIDNDTEGWKPGCATGDVISGNFELTASPITHTAAGYDPQISNSSLSLNAALYNAIEIRVKCEFNTEDVKNPESTTIYFATTTDSNFDEKKTFRANYDSTKLDSEGYATLRFDTTANESWAGIVSKLRFDPTNYGGKYYIDYIKLIKDPDAEAKAAEAQKAEEERLAKYLAADKGEPFYLINPDGESGDNSDGAYYSHNAKISIVDDPLKAGNKVISVVPSIQDKVHWVYVYQKTRFKPGVTYKIEFDYYAAGDKDGNPVENVLPQVNLRYYDVVNGQAKASADHNKPVGKASTKDGWIHFTFEHTISANSTTRDYDEFSIFTSPLQDGDNFRNISYMLDNIKVSVVEG